MATETLGLKGAVHITAWQKCPDHPDEPWKDKLIKDTTTSNLIVNVGKDTILKGIGGSMPNRIWSNISHRYRRFNNSSRFRRYRFTRNMYGMEEHTYHM